MRNDISTSDYAVSHICLFCLLPKTKAGTVRLSDSEEENIADKDEMSSAQSDTGGRGKRKRHRDRVDEWSVSEAGSVKKDIKPERRNDMMHHFIQINSERVKNTPYEINSKIASLGLEMMASYQIYHQTG